MALNYGGLLLKKLSRENWNIVFSGHPKNRAKARKAVKRLKTIAGRLVREIERILPANIFELLRERCIQFYRALQQKREDKQKLYSLHEPHVNCMSKAKDHKKYEFGTKVSITVRRDSKIIVGALALE